jgi:hypothetical protein
VLVLARPACRLLVHGRYSSVVGNIRSRVIGWLGRRYFARTQKDGFDLSKIAFLPDSVLMPLWRDGLDPVSALGHTRAQAPISDLDLPFGMKGWLVSGYAEAKAVLGRATGVSSDFTNLVGNVGVTEDQNPGGLGFADPPVHTRLRRLLTPEFTMRRLSRLTQRIESIVAEQLDAMDNADGPVMSYTDAGVVSSCQPVGLLEHFPRSWQPRWKWSRRQISRRPRGASC